MIFFHSTVHQCISSHTDDARHQTLNDIVMTWHSSEPCWTTGVNHFSFSPTRPNKIYFLAIKSLYIYCLLLLEPIVCNNSQMNSSKNKSNIAMKRLAKQTIIRRKWQSHMYRFDGQVQMTRAWESGGLGSTCAVHHFSILFISAYNTCRNSNWHFRT